MTHLIKSLGLPLLFVVIGMESAGIPLPGETSLIVAAALAQHGHFNIAAVIAVAAAGAIVGDNAGYWAARKGGRRLLQKWGRIARWSDKALPRAERFFERPAGTRQSPTAPTSASADLTPATPRPSSVSARSGSRSS